MRRVRRLSNRIVAVLVVMIEGLGFAAAEEAVMIGRNPTECEVAQALGITKPGCPPPPRLEASPKIPEPLISASGPAPVPVPVPVPVVTTVAPQSPGLSPPPVPTPTLVPAIPRLAVRHEFKAAFQIAFEFGSARLTEDARNILNLVGAALIAPDAAASHFRIIGHTDRSGTDASNLRLSQQRADAVRDYLVAHFAIAPARLQSLGKGAEELLDRDHPKAAENRRVEITNLAN